MEKKVCKCCGKENTIETTTVIGVSALPLGIQGHDIDMVWANCECGSTVLFQKPDGYVWEKPVEEPSLDDLKSAWDELDIEE